MAPPFVVAFHPSVIFLWLACIGLVLSLWHALRQKRATQVFHQRPLEFKSGSFWSLGGSTTMPSSEEPLVRKILAAIGSFEHFRTVRKKRQGNTARLFV